MNLFELAHVINDYEGALRASLQSAYGIRLLPGGGGRTEPARTPRELADLVAHLPRGCALWVEVGGGPAITQEADLLRFVIFDLEMQMHQQAGGEGRKPELIPLPRPAAVERAEQREAEQRQAAKAHRHANRDRRRSQRT